MRRSAGLLAAAAGAALLAALPAMAFAGSAPVIESLSASHITANDATLEARINPEGLETTYELWMEDPCRPPMECIRVPRLLDGAISATAASESLSVDLASSGEQLNIEPHMHYGYWLIAKNAAGTTEQQGLFTTPSAPAPVVESVSISHLTSGDATLEAQIDTEGLATTYRFTLQRLPCSYHGVVFCEMVTEPITLPSGELLGSYESQRVSLDLNSAGVQLIPGEAYAYSVLATSSAGSTAGPSQSFEAPPEALGPPAPTVSRGPISQEPVPPPPAGPQTTSPPAALTPAGAGPTDAPRLNDARKLTPVKPLSKHERRHRGKRRGASAAGKAAHRKR